MTTTLTFRLDFSLGVNDENKGFVKHFNRFLDETAKIRYTSKLDFYKFAILGSVVTA